jgi:prepilin-type N-terminal cleavage/methylation domain-containing protein
MIAKKRSDADFLKCHHRGFTLVELLVAMSITTILLLTMLQVTAWSLNLWRSSEGKNAAGREGQGALQLIRQDLQTMIVPTNTNFWPQVVGSNGVRFLALKPKDFQANDGGDGDVCFVEYRYTTHAIERGSVALQANGTAVPSGQAPQILQLNFQAAPNSQAISNYAAGINVENQQISTFFLQVAVPEPN